MAVYHITLTADEVESLGWLAARHTYADTLWKLMGGAQGDGTMDADLSESEAWELKQAIEEEDGFLPCCGGSPARHRFRNSRLCLAGIKAARSDSHYSLHPLS